MPPAPNLAALLSLLDGGSASATASAPMSPPMPTIAPEMSPMGTLDLGGPAPQAPQASIDMAPSRPSRSGGGTQIPWAELIRTITPAFGALAAGGRGPGATGFMQGYQSGQQMAQEEREKREKAEQDRKARAGQFRMEVFEQASQITDPRQWSQYIDLAVQTGMELGLIREPAELKQRLTYPSHLEQAKNRTAAIARLEKLVGMGYDLDTLAEHNPMITIEGLPYKFRDLVNIAGSLPQDAAGALIAPPKKPLPREPTGTETERAQQLLGRIRAAEAKGDTATAMRLKTEYQDLLRAKKEIGQADDRPRVTINTGDKPLTKAQRLNAIRSFQRDWNRAIQPVLERRVASAKLDSGLAALGRGHRPAATEIILIAFQKMQDETSVVREAEYGRPGEMQSLRNRIDAAVTRLVSGGSNITEAELRKLAAEGKALAAQISKVTERQLQDYRQSIEETIADVGIKPSQVFGQNTLGTRTAAPSEPSTATSPARVYYDANGNPIKR